MQLVVQGRARVLAGAGREAVGVGVEERDASRVPGPMALTVRLGRFAWRPALASTRALPCTTSCIYVTVTS